MDDEFSKESRKFFDMAKAGDIALLVSELLFQELEGAPEDVRKEALSWPRECLEKVELTEEAIQLRDAYLAAKVVGPARKIDAYHVALATVARADMIVSWNFKHMVHFEKIRGFNSVNLREGYLPLEIHSPKEIV